MDNVRLAFNLQTWKPIATEVSAALSVIQKEEKNRIMQFVFQKDAKASLIGRLLIRYFSSKYIQIPWSDIKLKRNAKGKPFLDNSNLQFKKFDLNVSHQGLYSVFAASPCSNLGIDIMKIQSPTVKNVPQFFHLMTRQFSSSEWDYIKQFETEQLQLKAFYRMWCLKEAYVKALGVGITIDLQSITFEINEEICSGKTILTSTVHVNGRKDSSMIFEESMLDEDHIVTVARTENSNKVIPEFQLISFNELMRSSETVCDQDDEAAESFVSKKETPWSM